MDHIIIGTNETYTYTKSAFKSDTTRNFHHIIFHIKKDIITIKKRTSQTQHIHRPYNSTSSFIHFSLFLNILFLMLYRIYWVQKAEQRKTLLI